MRQVYVSPKEYADIYRVHLVTVYRHIEAGKLNYKQVGNAKRIPIPESDYVSYVYLPETNTRPRK